MRTPTSRAAAALAASVLVMVAATVPAGAVSGPLVSISEPDGQTSISQAASPTLHANGAVRLDTPLPTEGTFYLRRKNCFASEARLSTTRGDEGPDCAWEGSITPLNEVYDPPQHTDHPATDGVPFTLDSSRPLEGVVTHTGYQPIKDVDVTLPGFGLTTIEISVFGTELGATVEDPTTLGNTTVSYVATPPQATYSVPWSIDLPTELDRADFVSFTLRLVVRGYNALHGFTVPNDTNVTVPIYSASFERRVEVAVDDGPFNSDGVNLSDNFTTWSTTIDTPAVGTHTLRARAVQGWLTSRNSTRSITVVE